MSCDDRANQSKSFKKEKEKSQNTDNWCTFSQTATIVYIPNFVAMEAVLFITLNGKLVKKKKGNLDQDKRLFFVSV